MRQVASIVCTTVLLLAAGAGASEVNTSSLGQNGWYSDDTRADGSGTQPMGTNLISPTLTDDPEATASGTAAHDADILSQIMLGLPPVAPPPGEHPGAAHLSIAPGAGSGKSQISHRKDDASGHGSGSLLADPGFLLEYSWMGDGTANVTAAVKIGIKTAEFGSTGVSSRTGENVWDKVLIYEPINNGGTADGTWQTETVTRTSGGWWFFDRTAGASSNFAPFQTLAGMDGNATVYSGAKTIGDVYALITDPGAVITSIQVGIGSGNAGGSVYVNQLETSFYRPGDVTTFGPTPSIQNVDTGELFTSIQDAHDDADTLDGDTLEVIVPVHSEGIVSISKNLTLRSESGATVLPTTSTTSSGDGRGWFVVQEDTGLHVENLTFDGAGKQIYQAFRIKGGGSFHNCHFRNISFSTYVGVALVPFGDDVDITGCSFENIQRVGVLYFGAGVAGSRFEDNTYTGKGDGDFLDYCLDISAGARVFARNNTVTDCRGVASSDGSTSAAFLVTTFFGGGTEAIFTGNTMSDNTTGIAVGFDGSDTSTVAASFNNFSGNDNGIFSTAQPIDADRNWWGDASGPLDSSGTVQAAPGACPPLADATNPGGLGDEVDDMVSYCPWLLAPVESAPAPGDGLVDVTKANGDFVAGSGIAADNFTAATNGEVTVWLKARNRDTPGSQPVAQSGNVYYINPDNHQQIDFQFTPTMTDTVGGGNYHLRLSWDLDPTAGTTGALCPGSTAAATPFVLDLPLFDADADPSNSWDDGDGLFLNPGSGAWSTDDVAYVYSQSWRSTFGFINGALLCPGDYAIEWEVLEGGPGDPSRTSLAKSSIVMRVLDTPNVVPTHLNLTAWQTCPGLTGSQLIVDLEMQQVTDAVNGSMFFLEYDNSLLDFVSAEPGLAPFTREIYEVVDEIGGTIEYASGVQNGSGPATADGRLARFTFNIGSPLPEFCSMSDLVSFAAHVPPTQLSKPDATAVFAEEANLPPVEGDLTPPAITPPSDIVTPADAGLCSAAIDPGLATAVDGCDAEPEITFSRSDGKPDLLDPYDAADSPITITWAAQDDCGNVSYAVQTVTVESANELSVSVQLTSVDPGPFTRCITFELFDCGNLPAAVVSEELTFTGGLASAVLDVPCGAYSCITARDELHTLRRTDDDGDFAIAGTQYVSDFTASGTTNDSLIGGNVNDDFYIDILDFGGYAGQFGSNYGGGSTTCLTSPLHADFNGDGVVGAQDFTFVQVNFLEANEANCCMLGGATAAPVDRISVAELRARGDHALAAGDINHDGWLDQDDLSAFLLAGGEPCTADFNADGGVNVHDLLLYLDLWFQADPAADLAAGPAVDIFDLLAFLDAWFAGCP